MKAEEDIVRFEWIEEYVLATANRPGRHTIRARNSVPQAVVDSWIRQVKDHGIQSIICLLGDDQLPLYEELPDGLIEYYRQQGFQVEHVSTRDHASPLLTEEQLHQIYRAYCALSKPVLVHCSYGHGRSGAAVQYIASHT